MRRAPTSDLRDELRPEYDLRKLLRGGIRGKYAKRFRSGSNLVLLDPDVARAFTDERAVNDALRLVIRLGKIQNGRRARTASPRRARLQG